MAQRVREGGGVDVRMGGGGDGTVDAMAMGGVCSRGCGEGNGDGGMVVDVVGGGQNDKLLRGAEEAL